LPGTECQIGRLKLDTWSGWRAGEADDDDEDEDFSSQGHEREESRVFLSPQRTQEDLSKRREAPKVSRASKEYTTLVEKAGSKEAGVRDGRPRRGRPERVRNSCGSAVSESERVANAGLVEKCGNEGCNASWRLEDAEDPVSENGEESKRSETLSNQKETHGESTGELSAVVAWYWPLEAGRCRVASGRRGRK